MKQNDNLVIRNVSMQFKKVTAVENFDGTFERGKIYGLIGTNGAGKSTVINMVSGSYRPSSGEILLGGIRLDKLPSYKIAEYGIARTFQNLRIFKQMTVLDNIVIAQQMRHHYRFSQMLFNTPGFRKTEEEMRRDARKYLEMVGIEHFINVKAGSLAYGHQRRLEIARCLATNPKVLLLDEPAAGMNPNESLQLVKDIRKIHEETDVTIILVEHDMKVIMGLCEYIYAMASGKIISQGLPEHVRHDPIVVEAYLGGAKKDA